MVAKHMLGESLLEALSISTSEKSTQQRKNRVTDKKKVPEKRPDSVSKEIENKLSA